MKIMPSNNRPTEDELQEKALYDILQYLPLDEVELKDGYSINKCISIIERDKNLSETGKKAIKENLPAIKAIIKDRPELGKAKISNMSWQDNDGDGNPDHNPEGMQACTFERDDQVYISFRGTPARSWIDNAKAFVKDMKKSEVIFNAYKIMMKAIDPTQQIGENTRNIIRGYIGMDYVFPWEKVMRGIEEKILDISEPKSNTTSEKGYGKFGAELRDYTSPMQEEALDYMESLKKSGVFEKYDNVYVTGHSKGGNEATLVTMVYSDVIDRCISGDGQGFSPEFVEYMKKTLGPEEFAKIQDKMYGFHANNDYVNVLGVSVIKVENRIYFVPEIKQESIIDILWNHLPTAMIDVKTGKIAQVSEQGAFGKFIAKVNEKIMKLDPKDREDVAITGMAFMQYVYVFTFLTSSNPDKLQCVCESATDMIDVVASFGNGISMLKDILLETLLEKEGVELVGYLVDTFILKHIKEYFVYMLEYVKIDWDEFNRTLAKYNEQDIVTDKDLENLKKYEAYGTSDFGTVAINYAKTKELVNILDEMNDLVEGRILPEMEDIADSLRRLSFWRVSVREWTDIKDSIEKNNNTRKIFKERVINYYNSCEIMEAKFVAGMYGGK
ncbi:hypothetical protein HMPREF9099_01024 [Lachnospiraceae bacterium oral taxon 082 str. F0431]|nr:hypothetical protein HMPREF9099_01024 [Lachnospiraceae bacterium oral taxon 082 str. F0431]